MNATDSLSPAVVIRRELRGGDPEAITELHRRVYGPEFGLDDRFVAGVARGLGTALAGGWPEDSGAVWLVQRGAAVQGSLGLTDEGSGVGRVRWFALEQTLRGQGLGRALLQELLAEARLRDYRSLELETFSALVAAAGLYRQAGFRLIWERELHDWGPPVVYQHYELELPR